MRKYVAYLCCIVLSSLMVQAEYAIAKEWLKFDTKGHEKAKGLWLTVKYPAGWKSVEGKHPGIVRRFSTFSSRTSIATNLTLQVHALPDGAMLEADTLSDDEWIAICKNFLQPNAIINNIKKIRHEDQNGIIISYKSKNDRVRDDLYSENEFMMLFFKERGIALGCGTIGQNKDIDAIITQHVKETHAICQQYFNSLVIMNKKTKPIITTHSYSSNNGEEYVIGQIKWGMSIDEIILQEGEPFAIKEPSKEFPYKSIVYQKDIFNKEGMIRYNFRYNSDGLNEIKYHIRDENPESATIIFNDLDKIYSDKYKNKKESIKKMDTTTILYRNNNTYISLQQNQLGINLLYKTVFVFEKEQESMRKEKAIIEKRKQNDLYIFK